jgi:hypothetical protein
VSQSDGIDISDILADPDVPKLYMNGFVVGKSLSDMFIIAQTASKPLAMIQMSFTTAKTLAEDLSNLIQEFENQTGQKLLSMRDIQQKQK